MLPVSNDTLLRTVRRRSRRPTGPLTVIGIDDGAFRRNHRYGSVVCDLERRRIVALLPDREAGTVEAWLAGHREIRVVSRDRGGGYGEAAAKALPGTVQVADRWHLMENASAAFLDAVRRSMRTIRTVVGATDVDPQLLTSAERLQYEGYLRREETNAAILTLAREGEPIRQIARRTGHSRKLVRQVVRGERTDVFRVRQSSLEAHLPLLNELWASNCRNGAELWRRLRARGFRGSLRVVGEWATRRRRAETASDRHLRKVPSARTIARLMTTARDRLAKADTVLIAAMEGGAPDLVEARAFMERFHTMIRTKSAGLDGWLADAASSSNPGRTGRLRDRSRNSSSSSARCMAEPSSTCSKPGSFLLLKSDIIKCASDPNRDPPKHSKSESSQAFRHGGHVGPCSMPIHRPDVGQCLTRQGVRTDDVDDAAGRLGCSSSRRPPP
jgi:transposase